MSEYTNENMRVSMDGGLAVAFGRYLLRPKVRTASESSCGRCFLHRYSLEQPERWYCDNRDVAACERRVRNDRQRIVWVMKKDLLAG